MPMILCCLQGCSQEQAAAQLGWTPGSVKGRLERGRTKLRERLMRRGVEWTAALLALEAVQGAPSAAAMPMGFIPSTLRAALMFATPALVADGRTTAVVTLAEESMRSLATTKTKVIAALLLAVSVAAGVGTMAQVILTVPQAEEHPAAQTTPEATKAAPAEATEQIRADRYGDPLPPGAILRLGTIRLRHGRIVYALPERDAFLSVLQKLNTIHVCKWQMSTGKRLHEAEYQLNRGGAHAAASSDGKMLAASAFDDQRESVIRLWDLASGKVLREIKTNDIEARVLAFSPDGATIAVGDGGQSLWLWELNSKAPLRRFEGTKDRWVALAFSPDGKILASSGSSEGALRLWDTTTRRELRALNYGDGLAPQRVVFSPDGKTVAAATNGEKNTTILLWDAATGKIVRQIQRAVETDALAFSPDSKILAAGGTLGIGNRSPNNEDRGSIHLWDVSSGREVRRLPGHFSHVVSLAFSTDGKWLISAGDGFVMKVWDVATGKEAVPLPEHEGWIHSVAFSPDGRLLATGGLDGSIRLWETATGNRVHILSSGVGPGHVALAPDGRTLISDHFDGSSRIWNVATGRETRRLQMGEEDPFYRSACSPDGQSLAVRSKDGTIALLDAASSVEKRRFTGGMKRGSALLFSPDGGKLASLSFDSPRDSAWILQVWDVATGKETLKRTLPIQTPLGFSTDGKTLFGILLDSRRGAVNPSYSLRLWDVAGGPDRTVKVPECDGALSLAVSPDGRMLAWGDFEGTITLWDLAANQIRRRFKEHTTLIHCLAFSPDSKTLASGGEDTTVLIWNVTGRPMTRHFVAPSPERLPSLWDDLASKDAAKAFDAIGLMTASPEQAVPLLKDKLKPAPVRADAKHLTRLIADLDNERFEMRQKAMEELGQLGEHAEPALRAALADKPSLEARKRIDELLEGIRALSATPERLRELRAVEILEHIGTSGAQQVLQTLAEGSPAARLTREAKAARYRLAKRSLSGERGC